VSLVDPLRAVVRQQPEQEHQRQREQDRGGVPTRRDRCKEAEWRETEVDRPDERDHADMDIKLGYHAREPHPRE
jgi:hypothetical protein